MHLRKKMKEKLPMFEHREHNFYVYMKLSVTKPLNKKK